MTAYATPADLEGVVDPVPANAELLLTRASRNIDQALLTAVYDPTDPEVIDALKQATVEQVAGTLESGDKNGLGVTTKPRSFTIGKITVQRDAATASAPTVGGLVSQAYAILQAAGLTGQPPAERTWWSW